jgi:hypothetical protein
MMNLIGTGAGIYDVNLWGAIKTNLAVYGRNFNDIDTMDNVEYNNMTGADNTYIQNYTFSLNNRLDSWQWMLNGLYSQDNDKRINDGLASDKAASQGSTPCWRTMATASTACVPAVPKRPCFMAARWGRRFAARAPTAI